MGRARYSLTEAIASASLVFPSLLYIKEFWLQQKATTRLKACPR
ncbi:MAG: hypothetical protein WCR70_05060 [Sphaerochaetaceae bacterium]